jgi:hypothetical protein
VPPLSYSRAQAGNIVRFACDGIQVNIRILPDESGGSCCAVDLYPHDLLPRKHCAWPCAKLRRMGAEQQSRASKLLPRTLSSHQPATAVPGLLASRSSGTSASANRVACTARGPGVRGGFRNATGYTVEVHSIYLYAMTISLSITSFGSLSFSIERINESSRATGASSYPIGKATRASCDGSGLGALLVRTERTDARRDVVIYPC